MRVVHALEVIEVERARRRAASCGGARTRPRRPGARRGTCGCRRARERRRASTTRRAGGRAPPRPASRIAKRKTTFGPDLDAVAAARARAARRAVPLDEGAVGRAEILDEVAARPASGRSRACARLIPTSSMRTCASSLRPRVISSRSSVKTCPALSPVRTVRSARSGATVRMATGGAGICPVGAVFTSSFQSGMRLERAAGLRAARRTGRATELWAAPPAAP